MTLAFVLMNVELGKERETLEQLKKLGGVKEAHIVYGMVDIIAKLESKDIDSMRDFVSVLRGLDTVTKTVTMPVAEKSASLQDNLKNFSPSG